MQSDFLLSTLHSAFSIWKARVVQQQRHDVERVDSAGVPLSGTASTISMEPKPQQTGTGLLIRRGEVATTSGSTNSLPRGLPSRSPFLSGKPVFVPTDRDYDVAPFPRRFASGEGWCKSSIPGFDPVGPGANPGEGSR